MTRGWFDLFRDNGGPALYPESNRTSVVGDVQAITVYIVFATLLVAFLVVMPGMRREVVTCFFLRILTFKGSIKLAFNFSYFRDLRHSPVWFLVCLSEEALWVSVVNLRDLTKKKPDVLNFFFTVGICGCGWHTAEADISSAYRAFSNEKINGRIGVYIGLMHVNVTLDALPSQNNESSLHMDVAFNERFGFDKPTQLMEEFRKGLKKGLPFPILTVAEYMAVDAEGFCWGRNYRFVYSKEINFTKNNLLFFLSDKLDITATFSFGLVLPFGYWWTLL